ncbi:MAG: AraC family transcriptional regulator [Dokdonella sp.]|uniref:AraC family transcriptional regulator n=1 Tax=Dokdonella sp. TaxID=2291710 RepID=UPI003F80F892
MSLVDKAVWVIERNSSRELGLDAIAQACGVSRSHVANAFGATTGLSVVKYLRGRRLSEAARTLAAGVPDILTVAFDAGYASHEAFTRAFRDRFGVTPEQVRDARSVEGLALVGPLDLVARTPRALDPPRLLRQDALRVVGLAETHTFESAIRIPAQWQRFMAYDDAIAAKADPIPLGVTRAPDDEGRFEYVCAVEVRAIGHVPTDLVAFEVPACRYAVFEHRGHVSTIYDTYAAIWNGALPASGLRVADAPILERHHETFDPRSGEGGLNLWIPLAD